MPLRRLYRRGRNRRVRIQRPIPTGPPLTYKSKHRFIKTVDITPTSDIVPTWVNFNANGIYDPYIPLGGHQPMFVDQVAAMGFSDYFVLRSTINLVPTFRTISEQNEWPIIVGVFLGKPPNPTVSISATSNLGDAMLEFTERNFATSNVLLHGTQIKLQHNTRRNLKRHYNAKRFWGLSKFSEMYTDSNHTGEVAAGGPQTDPPEQVYWQIWTAPIGGAGPDPTGVYLLKVELEYEVLWMRRITGLIEQS